MSDPIDTNFGSGSISSTGIGSEESVRMIC